METKKITLATLKSFVNKNKEQLYLKVESSFSGMTDMVETIEQPFSKAEAYDGNLKNTLGFRGIWLVGSSRDYIKTFENDTFKGFAVSNCCGDFLVAIKK